MKQVLRLELLVTEDVRLVTLYLSVIIAALTGCGSGGEAVNAPPPPSAITLSVFSNPVPAGSPGFMGIANGGGFTETSILYWNGQALETSIQTSGILYASVPAALLLQPGSATLYVKDSKTGASSNSLKFAILSSAAVNAGVIELVSTAIDGSAANDTSQVQPSISATGRYVTFQSAATNLVSQAIITPWNNIYLRDTCVGAAVGCVQSTQLISVSADGSTGGDWQSRASTVSQDGRYVAFDSGASNLLNNTPAFCNSNSNCVYLRDTCVGAPPGCIPTTVLGSIGPGETQIDGAAPVLTPTGRYLTFGSNGLPAEAAQIYRRDWCFGAPSGCTQSTVLISSNANGDVSNEGSQSANLSQDGRFVGFVSYSTNLIDPNEPAVQSAAMMFAKDTCLGATTPCSPSVSQVDVPNGGGVANNQLDYESVPSLSSNGRYIAYSSNATNLVAANVEGFGNVYLRDTCLFSLSCTPNNVLVSLANDGSIANSGSHQQSMSADGRYVAFTSISTNLVYGISYPAGSFQDVYVRDTCIGAAPACYPSTVRVAVLNTPNYQTPSNAGASLPSISSDGHYVVFLSSSTNLTPAGTNGFVQVFLSKTGF